MTEVRYLTRKINGRSVKLHRWIWEQAHGPIPAGYVIHHVNGDRRDNRLENLQMMTCAEHSRLHNDKHPRVKVCVVCEQDFVPAATKRARALTCSRGCFRRHLSAIRTGGGKLTAAQRGELCQRIAHGEQQSHLAREYGVSPATVTRIKKTQLR